MIPLCLSLEYVCHIPVWCMSLQSMCYIPVWCMSFQSILITFQFEACHFRIFLSHPSLMHVTSEHACPDSFETGTFHARSCLSVDIFLSPHPPTVTNCHVLAAFLNMLVIMHYPHFSLRFICLFIGKRGGMHVLVHFLTSQRHLPSWGSIGSVICLDVAVTSCLFHRLLIFAGLSLIY